MVCSNITQFSCDNLCGNPLPCTNHYCTKLCHTLKSQPPSSSRKDLSESCEKCNLPCEKVGIFTFGISCDFLFFPLFIFDVEVISSLRINSFFFFLGEEAKMCTSMSRKMPSWRLSSLQSAFKTFVSLRYNGPCFRVYVLHYSASKGANGCIVLRWTLPQVVKDIITCW